MITRSSREKGGEWRQSGTKLSPSENQQSFLQAGKYLLNALGFDLPWEFRINSATVTVRPGAFCGPGSAVPRLWPLPGESGREWGLGSRAGRAAGPRQGSAGLGAVAGPGGAAVLGDAPAVRAGGAGGQHRAAAAPRLPRSLAAAAGGAGNAAVPQ